MFGIGIGGQFDVERDRTAVGRLRPGAARCIYAIGKDSGAAPPGIKPFQGGAQVAERGKRVGMSTDAARKGRVDEHGGRADRQRQQIVDEFAIMATDRCSGECCLEHGSAPRIDLVEDKLGASARGENGEEPGAGGGLQNGIGCGDADGECGKVANRSRCRKLLERDLFFAAHSMRRQGCGECGQGRKTFGGLLRQVKRGEVQNLGQLQNIIGIAE